MPKGSCCCGEIQYEYSGEPLKKVLCHCLTCRRISGSSNTVNIMIPRDHFQVVAGSPRAFSTVHENGMVLTVYFCTNCSSALYKEAEDAAEFQGKVMIQAGTLTDLGGLDDAQPDAELWVTHRARWLPNVPNAMQLEKFV